MYATKLVWICVGICRRTAMVKMKPLFMGTIVARHFHESRFNCSEAIPVWGKGAYKTVLSYDVAWKLRTSCAQVGPPGISRRGYTKVLYNTVHKYYIMASQSPYRQATPPFPNVDVGFHFDVFPQFAPTIMYLGQFNDFISCLNRCQFVPPALAYVDRRFIVYRPSGHVNWVSLIQN